MNKKRKQRIISLLLVALLIVTGIKQVVYADESISTVYTATDYTSFKEALFYAMDGDTILIMGSIAVKSDIDIGSTEKNLIIKRGTAESTISFSGGGGNVIVENIIFDGSGYKATSPFIYVASHTSVFQNCIFQNCGDTSQYLNCSNIGGAVRVDSGTNQFVNCQFKDNAAMIGGHMVIYDGTVQITGCTFADGAALSNGGAICVTGDTAQCVLNSSVITGNQAGDFGGGVSNTGNMTIDDSIIYDNIATNGGADIANKTFGTIELKDSIEQLTELFEPHNILPLAWVCDYDFEENIYIPDVDPYQENTLLKLQYEIISDDSEEETESTEPGTEEGTEPVDPSEPSTEETEQPTTPSDEDDTDSTEESTETPTDPSDSEQDTTPNDGGTSEPSQSVGDTNTDNSTHTDNSNNSVNTDNSNNSVNTDNSDNSIHTDNSDNSSVDNSSVDNSVTNNDSSSSSTTSNNTVDNSSVDNSKVDNSNVSNNSESSTTTTNTTTTTNNYYTTESNQAPSQTATQPIVIEVQNDSAAPDADNEKVTESGSSSPNIRIDAEGVDCVFEYVDGVYNISITAQKEPDGSDSVVPVVAPVQAVENSTDQEVNWLGIIQIVLLVAILLCLIWQPQRTRCRNTQGQE